MFDKYFDYMFNQNTIDKQRNLGVLNNIILSNEPFVIKLSEWCRANKKVDNETLIEAIHIYAHHHDAIASEARRLVNMSPQEVYSCFHYVLANYHPHMLRAKKQINEILFLTNEPTENSIQIGFKNSTYH